PVLQAADILIYRAHFVPIGQDQLPHLEITRELARRFNQIYGEVFPVPEPLLTDFPKVLGTDGRKMSKSYNNTILISEDSESLRKKVMSSYTDPQKIRKNDPGHPENCPIFSYHRIFNRNEIAEIEERCRKGELGCVECKRIAAQKINEYLEPLREKRKEFEKERHIVIDILQEGAKMARDEAQKTMEIVREKMRLWR
ncbi:MAG: tryptophan--tRNA ligase, partial [candidate division WOR-3 bacterium]